MVNAMRAFALVIQYARISSLTDRDIVVAKETAMLGSYIKYRTLDQYLRQSELT
jgi:hypothetical protein